MDKIFNTWHPLLIASIFCLQTAIHSTGQWESVQFNNVLIYKDYAVSAADGRNRSTKYG
jgi:hypothetical protein